MGVLIFVGVAQAQDKPNIVLLYADDLGYADLSIYGNEYHQTPNIDSLMKAGMRFTQAYSPAALCAPSRVGLLSGRYPARFGVYEVVVGVKARGKPLDELPMVQPDNELRLPADNNTLGELLKAAGYRCGMFGKWHVGREKPSQRGFDDFVMLRNGGHLDVKMSYLRQSGDYPEPSGYSSDYISLCADQFLDKNDDRPFFLYLPHTLVHTAMGPGTKPLEPKEELKNKYKALKPSKLHGNPLYAGMVEALDQSVGALNTSLKKGGLLKNTLIIFTSDNGGLLGGPSGKVENGLALGRYTSNYPLKLGKSTLWEGGIRIPLSVTWPGHIEAGSLNDAVVSQLDFLPTLMEVAGGGKAPGKPMDGQSLWPLLRGKTPSEQERKLFWHYPGYRIYKDVGQRPASAVRWGDWKLVESLEDGSVQLFDLKNDISEQQDVAQKHPEHTGRLRKALAKWRSDTNAPLPTPRK
ncbi:Arylsulfatase [Stieleria bergensis]|uniref:Arylsulfatase n=2 Tax=Stieleria bergensis TaxID=2528025 RepID=A0A517SWU1_9BACT|nr:Arylsulfatase [Planctomycetes bacterium SV_7m_r]